MKKGMKRPIGAEAGVWEKGSSVKREKGVLRSRVSAKNYIENEGKWEKKEEQGEGGEVEVEVKR